MEIELRRKDLLLAISHGFLSRPEALEEWSEALLETVHDLEKHPAPAIAQRVVREAAGGDPDSQSKSEGSIIVLTPSMPRATADDAIFGSYLGPQRTRIICDGSSER
jgi:hypothetical protein